MLLPAYAPAMDTVVPQKNVMQQETGIVSDTISTVVILAMILPLLFMDACCTVYHAVYVRLSAVINVTEVYSCAIKHAVRHEQEHQREYFAYEEFR